MLDVWIGIHTLTSQDTSHETDYETNVVELIILEPNSSTSSDKHAKDTTSIFNTNRNRLVTKWCDI